MNIFLETTIPSYITVRPSPDPIRLRYQQLTREWRENHRQPHALFTTQLVLEEAALGVAVRADPPTPRLRADENAEIEEEDF